MKTDEDEEVISLLSGHFGNCIHPDYGITSPLPGFNRRSIRRSGRWISHEIAYAVAAGAAGGEVAENMATIVKLSRVLLLAPVAIIFGLLLNSSSDEEGGQKVKVPMPGLCWVSILASAIGTYAGFSESLVNGLVDSAYIFLGMAMAALGVGVNFKALEKGQKIFAVCFVGSLALFILVFIAAKLFF